MNKQQIKDRHEEANGTVKPVAGHVVGNEVSATKGKKLQNAGEFQAGVGDLKEKTKKDKKKKKKS